MANSRRIEKINILMREVIAGILVRNFQFAEGVLVTVTRVAASDDLQYAAVLVSILAPDADAEKNALAELARAVGSVQRELNRRLRMRPVPKITFAVDEEEKRRERIEKLLSEEPIDR